MKTISNIPKKKKTTNKEKKIAICSAPNFLAKGRFAANFEYKYYEYFSDVRNDPPFQVLHLRVSKYVRE